jgi:hypothetical protein
LATTGYVHSLYSVAVTEVNGDEFADLVYATYKSPWQSINGTKYPSENTIRVRLNQGNGTFGTETAYEMGGVHVDQANMALNSRALHTRDLNGDGRKDLVFADFENRKIHVRLHDNTSTMAFTSYTSGGEEPFGVAVADHTGDGNLDIAFGGYSQSLMRGILHGNGMGGFTFNFYNTSIYQLPIFVADGEIHGDGVTDIIASAGYSIRVSSAIQAPSGEYAVNSFFATGTLPTAAVVADFNNDGRPDVAAANTTTNNITILLNSCVP